MKMQKFIKKSCAGLVAMLTLATPPLLSQFSRADFVFTSEPCEAFPTFPLSLQGKHVTSVLRGCVLITDSETKDQLCRLLCDVYREDVSFEFIFFKVAFFKEFANSGSRILLRICVEYVEEFARRYGISKIMTEGYFEDTKQALEQSGFITKPLTGVGYLAEKELPVLLANVAHMKTTADKLPTSE